MGIKWVHCHFINRNVTIHHKLLQSWILNCLTLWYISWYSKSFKYHLIQYRNNYLSTRTAEIIYNMCMLSKKTLPKVTSWSLLYLYTMARHVYHLINSWSLKNDIFWYIMYHDTNHSALSWKIEILVYSYTPSELKRMWNQNTSCIILIFCFLVLSEQKHVDRLINGTWLPVESVPSTAVGMPQEQHWRKEAPLKSQNSSAHHWLLTQKLNDLWILLTSSSPAQT